MGRLTAAESWRLRRFVRELRGLHEFRATLPESRRLRRVGPLARQTGERANRANGADGGFVFSGEAWENWSEWKGIKVDEYIRIRIGIRAGG
jgi:hypothetical protein